jgi:hypothetical protein
MRDKSRRTLLLAAAAVMAVAAVVPGAVPAAQTASDDPAPGVSQLIQALGETTDAAPDHEERQVAEQVRGQAIAATAAAEAEPDAETATAANATSSGHRSDEEGSDPSTWVASVDILGSGDPPPEPPSDGKCPKSTSCDRNLVRPQKWRTADDGTLKIAWKFNDEGRRNLRAPTGLLEGSVRRSMAEWARWNSNVLLSYAGTTTAMFGADGADGSCADGTNVIGWHSFDPSVIAAVYTCIDPKTNTVRDADLALNVTQHWENISGEPESRHTFDIDSIVTHEIGHWLSLLDLYDAGSLHQTMMGNAEYGETRKRTLALGDIVGLQTAYPCDAQDNCPRKGIVDD